MGDGGGRAHTRPQIGAIALVLFPRFSSHSSRPLTAATAQFPASRCPTRSHVGAPRKSGWVLPSSMIEHR